MKHRPIVSGRVPAALVRGMLVAALLVLLLGLAACREPQPDSPSPPPDPEAAVSA